MLSKSVALFAAFAAFAPALAVPIPDVVSTGEILGIPLNYNSNKQSVKRDVADAIVYVKHDADAPIANVASSSKRDDPLTDITNIADDPFNSAIEEKRDNLVTAVVDVKNVANDALVNVASSGASKRDDPLTDITNVANDPLNSVVEEKRDNLVTAVVDVKNVANDALVNIASSGASKRQNYIKTNVNNNDVSDADNDHTKTTYGSGGKSSDSKSSGVGSLAVVDAYVNDVANDAHVNIASTKTSKRASVVGVVADVKNVGNNAHVNVASTKTSKRQNHIDTVVYGNDVSDDDHSVSVTHYGEGAKDELYGMKRSEVSSIAEVIVYLENILNYLKVNVL